MSISEEEVNKFHDNDDVDGSKFAHHHTLGATGNQASPGNHRHDGADSSALFNGLVDYFYNYNTEPYLYRNGVVVPNGVLYSNQPQGATASNYTGAGEKIVVATDDDYEVKSGEKVLIRFQAEVRVPGATSPQVLFARCRAAMQGRPPREHPNAGVLAPAPMPSPTTSSTEIGVSYNILTGSVYDTITVEWEYTPDINYRIHPAITLVHASGTAFDVRKASIRLISGGGYGLSTLLGHLMDTLAGMGANYGIRGDNGYYEYNEDPTP